MSTTLPRLSITINVGEGTNVRGKLNSLAIGFGIHQAWIYLAIFGIAAGGPLLAEHGEHAASQTPSAFIVSIVLYCCTLLFAAVTDQKFLRFYTAKRVIIGACLAVTLGTIALFFSYAPFPFGSSAMVVGGVATGIGSALLMLYWGTAFSRHGNITIIMNSIVAIMIALLVYSFVLHVVSWPYSGIFAALLPLFELPFLWQSTPVSYAVRHAVPIFDPLPVRKLPFSFRIALPALLFGLVMGIMRLATTMLIVPSFGLDALLIPLLVGGVIASLLLVIPLCFNMKSHWDGLFRPTVIFVSVTLLFLSILPDVSFRFETISLLIGYVCFEALMWVFLGEMAQEFRISPIFLFGLGQGSLALGSMISSLAFPDLAALDLSVGLAGSVSEIAVLMLIMITAYATMPHVRDIKRVAILCPQFKKSESIAAINRQVADIARKEKIGGAQCASLIEGAEGASLFKSEAADPREEKASEDEAAVRRKASMAGASAQGSLPQTPAGDVESAHKIGRFRQQCEVIANRYLLSRRETEVMFLLAKGYNAALIQDKLYISKSTAKTHIDHIYRKLNIHSQQELIRMVEEIGEA